MEQLLSPTGSVKARSRGSSRDSMQRLKKIRILVADQDVRVASLITGVLRSFGFEQIQTVHDGVKTLQILRDQEIDLVITEWDLKLLDGIRLIQTIRKDASQRWQRDLPVIILTGKADLESVRQARDAGFTEFVAKPFSAQTLSTRLLQMIDNPRNFVITEAFIGPCRRRRITPDFDPKMNRRGHFAERPAREAREIKMVEILPPNRRLMQLIGDDVRGADIFTDKMIGMAQNELRQKESQFIEWAHNDIGILKASYRALCLSPSDEEARAKLIDAAYSLKSQAGIFGYDMGTEVGRMLLDYLPPDKVIHDQCLVVLRKYLDTIILIFTHKVKEAGGETGAELIRSLQMLERKIGSRQTA